MTVFLQNVIFGIGAGSLDALLAMGVVLIFRTTGVLNFSQAAIGTLSAYVAYAISEGRPLASLWLALPASIAVGGFLGVSAYLAVRSIRSNQRALTSAVATLAIAVLIEQVIRVLYGTTVGVFPHPLDSVQLTFGEITVPGVYLGSIATALVIATAIGAGLRYTRIGTMIRALADNREAGYLCGANVDLLIGGVWALAGALAAAAGFFAAQIVFLPSFLDPFFIGALIAAVLGGLRSLLGAFVGAAALEVARNMFQSYAVDWSQYAQTFLIVLLIVVLVLTPRKWLVGETGRTV